MYIGFLEFFPIISIFFKVFGSKSVVMVFSLPVRRLLHTPLLSLKSWHLPLNGVFCSWLVSMFQKAFRLSGTSNLNNLLKHV